MISKQDKECTIKDLADTHHFLKIQLVTLHLRWSDYKKLFGHSKERVDLLNQCAGGFFHATQFALLQQFEVSIVRLLDPHQQRKNKNLTFSRLVHLAEEPLQERQVFELKCKLEHAEECSKRLKKRRDKAVAHLDVRSIQNEDQAVLEWPRIEEVDASLKALADLANSYEQMIGLPIMMYEFSDNFSGSELLVSHLENSLRLKELVQDGFLSRELAYPKRFSSKNFQATR